MGRKYELSNNPLTRQGVLCQNRRRGDSPRVIDNPLTCQGALCNRSERQEDSPRVIDNPLTCQGALCNRSERQGDSPRVIDNPLTCQGALCNRRERQGDSQRAIDTDLDHGSITTVQNRDLLKESNEQSYEQIDTHHMLFNTYMKLLRTYEKLIFTDGKLQRLVRTCCNKLDLHIVSNVFEFIVLSLQFIVLSLRIYYIFENKSKTYQNIYHSHYTNLSSYLSVVANLYGTKFSEINQSIYIEPRNIINNETRQAVTTEYEVLHASSCDYFSRSRLRTKSLIHVRKRDREPSRIPVKKLVNLMRKNRKRRYKIKLLIKRLIPKSSAWHNLLSTQYRKNAFHRQTNEWRFWKCPCCTIKSKKMHRAHKHVKLSKLNRKKVLSTSKSSKCDIQRLTSCDKYSLFVCGDVELNPGPVNNLISTEAQKCNCYYLFPC
jgi:hypothetical protein